MKRLDLVTRVTEGKFCGCAGRAWLAGVLGILLCAPMAQAAAVFDFIQAGSGDVLATLTLEGDAPWDHTAVSSLVFTEAGDAIFGFGIGEYPGDFDETIRGFEPDGLEGIDAGLKGAMPNPLVSSAGLIIDIDPPNSNDNLTLWAGATTGDRDFIITTQTVQGDWIVPEPGSASLALVAGLGLVAGRRRRQR